MSKIKYFFVLSLLIVFASSVSATKSLPNWSQRKDVPFSDLERNFNQPDMHYAPFMFWFWDEPLNFRKMAEMSAKISSQHINPGYAHPRTTAPGVSPLNPLPKEQWLSDIWFKSFDAALNEAEKAGTYLGYCDEYMWPTLQLGGKIAEEQPQLRAIQLTWETMEAKGGEKIELPECYFAVAAKRVDALKALPKKNLEPKMGSWIWKPSASGTSNHAYLRKKFDIKTSAAITRAQLKITVDNRYQLYINGKHVGTHDNWQDVKSYDVSNILKPGSNLIAIEGDGDGGIDAFLMGLIIEAADGKVIEISSDGSWKVSETVSNDWQVQDYNDSKWEPAKVINSDANASPWNLSFGGQKHINTTIESNSLVLLNRGKQITTPLSWQVPDSGFWRIYLFSQHVHGTTNGIDSRLAGVFIEQAHTPYLKRYGEKLGQRIPGVFVDTEGHYGYKLAWSDSLAKHYGEKFGDDIRRQMPLMLDRDVEGQFACVRWQWFDAVSDLYAQNLGSISDWCGDQGMYCIENLWEESLQWQAQYVGDYFKLSRAFSMPGNDCLFRKAVEVHDFKECSSVAEFEGSRLMSEVMGAGGWDHYNPTFMKQAANSLTAWGVGHVVPHGIFTRRNQTNNRWVPDWYDENPMFSYLHLWADFVRRASYVNSHGHNVPDMLLLNPMDTVWVEADTAIFDPTTKGNLFATDKWYGNKVQHLNDVYSDAITQLTIHRIEFLIADRYYINKMKVESNQLVYKSFRFKSVLIPPISVLPIEVAQCLVQFAKAGGPVYAIGELPTISVENGASCKKMKSIMQQLRRQKSFHQLTRSLDKELSDPESSIRPQVSFRSGDFPLLTRHVRIDNREFFWLANNTENNQTCILDITGARGQASIWDCSAGSVTPIASQSLKKSSVVTLAFRPLEGFWLVFDPEKKSLSHPVCKIPSETQLLKISGPWQLSLEPDIQPVLEYPVQYPSDFTRAGGIEKQDLQEWKSWPGLERFVGHIDYQTEFDLQNVHDGEIILDMGRVCHMARVWVNDEEVGTRLWKPYRLNIKNALRPGRNKLRIRVGNLVQINYGAESTSGLLGPVTIQREN